MGTIRARYASVGRIHVATTPEQAEVHARSLAVEAETLKAAEASYSDIPVYCPKHGERIGVVRAYDDGYLSWSWVDKQLMRLNKSRPFRFYREFEQIEDQPVLPAHCDRCGGRGTVDIRDIRSGVANKRRKIRATLTPLWVRRP